MFFFRSFAVFSALIVTSNMFFNVEATKSKGGEGGGSQVMMENGMMVIKGEGKKGDTTIVGDDCSPIKFMHKSGKKKKGTMIMIMNKGSGCCKKPCYKKKATYAIPMIMMPDYSSGGGYGGGSSMGGGYGGGSSMGGGYGGGSSMGGGYGGGSSMGGGYGGGSSMGGGYGGGSSMGGGYGGGSSMGGGYGDSGGYSDGGSSMGGGYGGESSMSGGYGGESMGDSGYGGGSDDSYGGSSGGGGGY